MDEQILQAILKKALGYTVEEVAEEYSIKEGEEELTKRKITSKYIPPDNSALKLYLDTVNDCDCSALTDEELMEEKRRLLKQLKQSQDAEKRRKKK